ncbi:hypothetical protein IQ249_24695 [Lusitaniella coriacea LEGE 07157]|uniref:Uncharacterized protein n=1 Tax=Lusitaniella coriacea LEGE 07157 TaxID=945747 RepID=A0A8J7J6Y3_9CYAN|nr:hypothetical protein [Lusitaniella coriacea]MBE9119059.1 hypothetical protein [Lusitaniella coriacea LEGE 07157]
MADAPPGQPPRLGATRPTLSEIRMRLFNRPLRSVLREGTTKGAIALGFVLAVRGIIPYPALTACHTPHPRRELANVHPKEVQQDQGN